VRARSNRQQGSRVRALRCKQRGELLGDRRGSHVPVICNCEDHNWYGAPDAFTDGAADHIEFQTNGEGTLSVYASYALPPL